MCMGGAWRDAACTWRAWAWPAAAQLQVWSRALQAGLVYAPLCACPGPRAASGVVVASHGGVVQWLCAATGSTGWRAQTHQRISAAPTWLQQPAALDCSAGGLAREGGAAAAGAVGWQCAVQLVVVVSTSGTVIAILVQPAVAARAVQPLLEPPPPQEQQQCLPPSPAHENDAAGDERARGCSATVAGCAALPGEVFSSPVLSRAGQRGRVQLLLGCRDDHLYCVDVLLVGAGAAPAAGGTH